MKPALFLVGPPKTGTTAIWHALYETGVPLAQGQKESFYFDRHYDGDRERYLRRYFRNAPHVIEVSPSYFPNPDVPGRIKAMFPEARIVVTLREPVARTVSMYGHMLRYGRHGDIAFADAVTNAPTLLQGSRYIEGCRRWVETFGADRVMVLRQDDTGEFPEDTFQKLADFSELDEIATAAMPDARRNESMSARSPLLSRWSADVRLILRRCNGGALIGIARACGAKKLLYSSDPGHRRRLGEEDLQLLRGRIADEIRFFHALPNSSVTGNALQDAVALAQPAPANA